MTHLEEAKSENISKGSPDNTKPQILIVIVHGLYMPWIDILRRGQLQTWLRDCIDERVIHAHAIPVWNWVRKVDEYFYFLNWHKWTWLQRTSKILQICFKIPILFWKPSVIFHSNRLADLEAWQIQMPDLSILGPHKTRSILEASLQVDWDFVLLTTSSSYINIQKLRSSVQSFPKCGLAAGRVLDTPHGKFVGGCFRIFSRDLIEIYFNTNGVYPHFQVEDRAIFTFLRKTDILYRDLNSIDLYSNKVLVELANERLHGITHFRCKSGSLDNRDDVETMHNLRKKF